ncbi:hypothetical protein Poli38472_006349 [Pythium oligandrum]|uniref:Spindle pole body component n=1 Tax=Pythium oligandrum TaxID=41045 RepID=A0A8K1FCZ0_PYTOL|nr:hypothetical protein Poli38472_006349 [Pythium oligandrum]|eukprot:TMW56339.1 hypothetical protein Poli38472_006349 [Pythium oligandrum]
MHHELFFALLGHAGDVIEAKSDGFFIRRDVSFLSAPQKAMIDRLLQLGHAFATLERFVADARHLPSLYLRGLAQGVERVLGEYTDAIVALEAKILTTRVVFPIPQMMYELEEYVELLPELCKLVRRIRATRGESPCLRGAPLLELLHRMMASGFPRLRRRIQELLHCCHRILFKQIVSWVLYADVLDPFDEFFVKSHDDTASSASVESQIWQSRFRLDLEAVPLSYFPIAVADSILFIGKSIQILARANGFAPTESQQIVTEFMHLTATHEFSTVALEQVVEKTRRHVAGRLYQEVVVKSDFVDRLRVLKDMFLLSHGELFQALIDRTSTIMTAKPSFKSEDELHHSIWSQILHDFHLDDASWTKPFSFRIPLQCFHFPSFITTEGLALLNVRRDAEAKSLEIKDPTQVCGTTWWRHAQLEHLPFTSECVLSGVRTSNKPQRVALFVSTDSTLPEPHLSTGGGFVIASVHIKSIMIECVLRSLPEAPLCAGVSCRVVSFRQGDQEELLLPPETVVETRDGACHVYVQHARVEERDAKGAVKTTRVLLIKVNDTLVMEAPFELKVMFDGDKKITTPYYLGLGWTSPLAVQQWTVDKFPHKAVARQPGQNLKPINQTILPRDLWNYLSLQCELEWPLQLLVSPKLLESYNLLFQFCLRLKRVAYALERTWKCEVLRTMEADQTARAASTLRGRMSFVLRNIELYFQVFVVEGCFSKCLADIEAAEDYDRVKRIHENLVGQLINRFFLGVALASSALDDVMSCCWDFAEFVLDAEHHGVKVLASDRIGDLGKQFTTSFDKLFSILERMDARDFLLLLDYNEHFSQIARAKEPKTLRSASSSRIFHEI